MMNRRFLMLSIMSFMTLVIYSLLMAFEFLNPIIHLKYILIFVSIFFTVLSVGLYSSNNEASQARYFLFVILLILPALIPLIGSFNSEAYSSYWKLFIGGTIFQIGTGIYSVLGGFIKKDISTKFKLVSFMNYSLFLILGFIFLFDITVLLQGTIFIIVGGVVSILSLTLVILRKSTIND